MSAASYAIVLAGSHQQEGMMPFATSSTQLRVTGLTPAEADAIHAYVIDRAQAAYEPQRSASTKP